MRNDGTANTESCVLGKNLLKLFRDMRKCLPQNMFNFTWVPTAEKKESKTSDQA